MNEDKDFSGINTLSEHHGYKITPGERSVLQRIAKELAGLADSGTIDKDIKKNIDLALANIYGILAATRRFEKVTIKWD